MPLLLYKVLADRCIKSRTDHRHQYLTKADEYEVFAGNVISATKRVKGYGGEWYCKLEDGRGWLVEAKQGVQKIDPIEAEEGLWVFRVTTSVPSRVVGLQIRTNPSFQEDGEEQYRATGIVARGSVRSFTERIKGEEGDWFYRFRASNSATTGWLFETKRKALTMAKVACEAGRWELVVGNRKSSGWRLREHPDHVREYDPAIMVPNGTRIISLLRVQGECGDWFYYVSFQNTSGWLFETVNRGTYGIEVCLQVTGESTVETRQRHIIEDKSKKKHAANESKVKAANPDDAIEAYLEAQLDEVRARRGGGGAAATAAAAAGGGASSRSAKRRRTEEAQADCFVCPISQDKMVDPVICADGQTYERSQIEEWLRTNNTSPKTNLPLRNKVLVPNMALKAAIAAYG